MKKFTRMFSLLLVLVLLFSNLAVAAFAYEINCGSGGSRTSRTYKIYHTFGTAVKITRYSQGVAEDPLGIEYKTYGKFTYTVKDSSGKTITSGTWNADSTKKTVTLVGALKKTGYYTITISGAMFSSSAYSAWVTYPKYKLTW